MVLFLLFWGYGHPPAPLFSTHKPQVRGACIKAQVIA